MALQRLDGRHRHVAGRHIKMQDARQNQLHRTAFGTNHHINARQIALKRGVDLVTDQQQKRHRAQPQRQKQQIKRRSQWP